MDWKVFLLSFSTIFLAELGDKTQLSCIMLSIQTKRAFSVFLGASLALIILTLVGVVFAQFITQWISPKWFKKISAIFFIGIGVLILFEKI